MSCHLMSRHVMSSHVLSCHVTSCHVMSCHVMSCHVMSCHLTSVMSCHLTSVMSRHVTSCHVMSCHVMSRHLARESCSRIFLPSLLNSSITAAGWPRRGFRNRGPVRESGSERRSRCGAACAASVCVGLVRIFSTWASFCVAGCGNRACWRCAGSVPATCPRRCAVGIGFRAGLCARMVKVRFAWQAAGIVWLGACPERARGPCRRRRAVGIGFRACRARAHDFTRCDLRFAWQAWEFGCIDVLGKALDGGSAWQAQ